MRLSKRHACLKSHPQRHNTYVCNFARVFSFLCDLRHYHRIRRKRGSSSCWTINSKRKYSHFLFLPLPYTFSKIYIFSAKFSGQISALLLKFCIFSIEEKQNKITQKSPHCMDLEMRLKNSFQQNCQQSTSPQFLIVFSRGAFIFILSSKQNKNESFYVKSS